MNHPPLPPPKSRHSALTLIELLVVIGIIVVLVILLYPVLGKARDVGNSSQSLSNMRGMAAAVLNFASDNNNLLPLLDNGNSASVAQPLSWLGRLVHGGYIDAPRMPREHAEPVQSVLRCPGDNGKVRTGSSPAPTSRTDDAGAFISRWLSTNPSTGQVESIQTSYMINGVTTQLNNPPFPFVRIPPDAGPHVVPAMTRINRPSRTIMFTTGISMHNRVFTNRVNARFSGKGLVNVVFFDGSGRSIPHTEIPNPMDLPARGGPSFRLDFEQ